MLTHGGAERARYEMKYIVSESKAAAIRSFIRPHLSPDEYAAQGDPPGYSVHSLYLDAPHLSLYRQTVDGEKNRFKLRIRFYDEAPDSPVFLEIKRRATDTISKSRAGVTRPAAEAFLRGERLSSHDLLKRDARSIAGLNRFVELCDRVQAVGNIFVSYRREAYVHAAVPGLRVTFDRELVGAPYRKGDGVGLPAGFLHAEIPGVILELKYIGRFPGWMGQLVQTFNLRRQSVPKYVECFDVLPSGLLSSGSQKAS